MHYQSEFQCDPFQDRRAAADSMIRSSLILILNLYLIRTVHVPVRVFELIFIENRFSLYIIPSAKSLNLAGGFCKTPFGRLVGLENG